MIRKLEALNYRCLRHISQEMDRFHVLIGPNGSGKSTFLDVISFLGTFVDRGLDAAIEERTRNVYDLLWQRTGDHFELALEFAIPNALRGQLFRPYDTVRYEVRIGVDGGSNETRIQHEAVVFKGSSASEARDQPFLGQLDTLCSDLPDLPDLGAEESHPVMARGADLLTTFYTSEVEPVQAWSHFGLPSRSSLLNSLPADRRRPVAAWLRDLLIEGIRGIALSGERLHKASPPGRGHTFLADGSNLPWVVHRLERDSPARLAEWVTHLQTALPDLQGISTIEREDDRHRYLVLEYDGGLRVPSWMVSDGTLRLLALTLPAYLPDFEGIYLIEEPENGVHPRAVETLFQSLSSVYGAQVLLATHSPVILTLVDPEDLLCFSKGPDGATETIRGDRHPALQEWQGQVNLSTLYAAGVLG